MKKLPKTIYIAIRDVGEELYFLSESDITEFDDGEIVGEYTLVETSKKRVTHALEKPSKRKR